MGDDLREVQTFLNPTEVKALWEHHLQQTFSHERAHVEHLFPAERAVIVDFMRLTKNNTALADTVLWMPTDCLRIGADVLKGYIGGDIPEKEARPYVRVCNLPAACKQQVQGLRSSMVGKFISMDVLVQRISKQKARILTGAFKCVRCGHITVIPMNGFMVEPLECDKAATGCGRTAASTRWDMVHSVPVGSGLPSSTYGDIQWAEVQDLPEGMKGGETTACIGITLADDLVNCVSLGDRVTINGVLHAIEDRKGPRKSADLQYYLSIVSVERKEEAYSDIEISEEEEKEIVAIAQSPDAAERLRRCVAPSIKGLLREKEALLLLMIGSPRVYLEDGTTRRGDLHALLIGDPGTSKSHLLEFVHNVAPRSVMAAGAAATGGGLTAIARQDTSPYGDGGWVAEAGLLVKADGGIAIIDEFDKMNENDREAIHQPMEQQVLPFAKAGMTLTFNTRCSVLAAANPKYGRWDDRSAIPDQVDLDPPLLSRFDLLLVFVDRPDAAVDSAVAEHVLSGSMTEAELSTAMLRKYLAYVKRTVQPKLSAEAVAHITAWYVGMRASAASDNRGPVTPRHLLSAQRLTLAKARMRLADVASVDDAKYGVGFLTDWLGKSSSTGGGKIDMSIITSGHSQADHDVRRTVLRLVEEMQGSEGAPREDIVARAESMDVPRAKAEAALDKLFREGELYEPRPGRFSIPQF